MAVTGVLAIHLSSCGGGGGLPPATITLSLAANIVTVTQDGTPATLGFTVTIMNGSANAVTVSATSLPSNMTYQVTQPSAGTGSVTFISGTGTAVTPAGNYTVVIQATDGSVNTSANLTLTVAPVVVVESSTNSSAGTNGSLSTFMSTSFGPEAWLENFFVQNPNATITLAALDSSHIRFQPLEAGTPETTDGTWDFSVLDALLDPVIALGDQSPQLQLPVAPDWMNDANGYLEPSHFQDFADYCAQVVEYYNTHSGFVDNQGVTHVHTSFTPITWWGIFNEPNINGLSASQYTQLYNIVVPAMQAAGSEVPLKFVAVELSDWGTQPQEYLPTFVAGATAQVDVVATHYYGTTNQQDPDQDLFSQVSQVFVPHVQYIKSQLESVPALANVPIWVTENNVNSDVATANGMSTQNPGQVFVVDDRGSSAFFAAWRPYVFSQLSQAGVSALYHWEFASNQQYGEVYYENGQEYLSYWVDYYLERYFPNNQSASILNLSNTEPSTVEALAVKHSDDSILVMIVDRAVHSNSDDNGAGDPRTIVLDLSALGTFTSASQLVIDTNTNTTNGPTLSSITPEGRLSVNLGGYGVTFLSLQR
jgi:hypothetical protein